MHNDQAAVGPGSDDVAGESASEHIRLVLEAGVQQPDQAQGNLQAAAPAVLAGAGRAALS